MPKVTTVTDTTHCKIASLSGYGDDYFKDQYLFVQRDNGGAGAAPQGEQAKVSDYTGADGTFQHEAFTVSLAVDDDIVLMHQILVDPKNDIVKVGGTSQTGADLVPLIQHLDTDLSKVSLGANVAQNFAQANYGYMYGFVASGTPIPFGTSQTLLDISGFGRLHAVHFDVEHTTSIYMKIDLDTSDILGLLRQACYAGYEISPPTDKLQSGFARATRWEALKYGIDFDTYRLGGGSFGSHCKVWVQNTSADTDLKVHIRANYLVSASKGFSITDPAEKDPDKVREDLASRLGIDPEGVTAVYQENWDEEKQLNIPSLSTIVHPRLSKAGEDEVREFLQARAIKALGIPQTPREV